LLLKNEQKLEQIFRIVLEIADADDVHEVRQISHPRWDSLAHVSLIAAIESELDVSISGVNQAEKITSFSSAVLLLGDMGL